MASHDYHAELPGFDEGQVLIDGCGECEHRSQDFRRAVSHMDVPTFERFWRRIVCHELERDYDGEPVDLSGCERRLADPLMAVATALQMRGVPIEAPPKAHVENVRDALAEVFGGEDNGGTF